jgi:hypothetical protein
MAHYQFGQEVLRRLDPKLRSSVLAFKQEFDIGLQGPDIFYFYKPYRRTEISTYGVARHNEPAVCMFAPLLEKVREKAALAYLIGLICHYELDRHCHSYAFMQSRARYDHQRMESAFDRHIMRTSGLSNARFLYLPAGRLDYKAMASLWVGIKANTIRQCVSAERRAIRFLDHRIFLETCEKVLRKPGALTPMTLPDNISGVQTEHARHLKALYKKALDECPELIRTALGCMGSQPVNVPGFAFNYKGIAE